jgi:hypothetical protein
MVIIDTRAQAEPAPRHPRVIYTHTPAPNQYTWNEFAHYSTPQAVSYERDLMMLVTSWLNSPSETFAEMQAPLESHS